MYVALKVMSSVYFHGNCSRNEDHHNTLIEQVFSYRTLFFSAVITVGYTFSPVMGGSLYAVAVIICASGGAPL